MPSFKRLYYGGGDVLIGLYVLANSGLIAGGFGDIIGFFLLGRGALILMSSL